MGGSRWCKNCPSSHEGPTGSKCQQSVNMKQAHTSEGAGTQASNITDQEVTVTQEQARLVADQLISSQDSTQATSTGAIGQQDLILLELQKMSQRLGKLETSNKQLKTEQCYQALLNN